MEEMSSLVGAVSDKAGGEESWPPSTAGPAKTGQAAVTRASRAGAFSRGLQLTVLPCGRDLGENTLTSLLSLPTGQAQPGAEVTGASCCAHPQWWYRTQQGRAGRLGGAATHTQHSSGFFSPDLSSEHSLR